MLILISYLTTIIPLLPLINTPYPIYVSLFGEYGSLFNRTYLINALLVGSLIGGFIVSITPFVSKKISNIRDGKMIPFQGIIITFLLLSIVGGVIQFSIK